MIAIMAYLPYNRFVKIQFYYGGKIIFTNGFVKKSQKKHLNRKSNWQKLTEKII